jgi:glycosyltransferase involved in cell wall biosynthesis
MVKPDIILVVNIADVYQAVNNLRQKGTCDVRVVTTLHGIHPGLIDDIDHYHKSIDAVLVTNKLTQKLVLEKTRIEPSNVLYAPYGVTILDHAQGSKKNEKSFTVSYVGRIEEDQKRISDLFIIFEELLKKHPDTTILIAGDGADKDMATLNQWLKKQANSKIHYLGVLSPEQLRSNVYHVSNVVLLTSHWETGPIVAWEAFQYDITLVSSKYIGCIEEASLVHGENCLMFDIGDNQQAVELLIQTRSKQLRQQLSQNSRSLLAAKYSIDISIAAWGAELQKVASRPAKRYCEQQKKQTDTSRILSALRPVLGEKSDRIYEYLHLFFRRAFKHHSAGGEWPHSYSSKNSKSSQLTHYISSSTEHK